MYADQEVMENSKSLILTKKKSPFGVIFYFGSATESRTPI